MTNAPPLEAYATPPEIPMKTILATLALAGMMSAAQTPKGE